jgi:hypothetical protein
MFTNQIDLWDRCGDLKWLQKNVTALHGPKRTLKISLVNPCDFAVRSVPNDLDPNDPLPWKGGYDDSWSETSVLELEVQKFDRRSNNVDDHFLRVVVVDRNGSAITKASFQQYAISVECLPSLDKLETWVLENTRHSRRPFFESGVHGTFFAFAWRYCQCKNELPLVSFQLRKWAAHARAHNHDRKTNTDYQDELDAKGCSTQLLPCHMVLSTASRTYLAG